MSKKEKEYRRVSGVYKGFITGRYHLYEGRDHILQVFSRFGIEDYRRYYFNDIQAIVITQTDKGKVFGLTLGLLGLIFSLFVITAEGGWAVFNGIILSVLMICFLFNWIKGPTCKTQIYTPVQTEVLPTLHRLRPSLKAIDRLKSLIEKRQGVLTPESLPKNLPPGPAIQTTSNIPTGTTVTDKNPSPRPVSNESGRYHFILFMLLLLFALINLTELAFTHIALTLLGSVIMMILFIFIIIALIRQHGSNMARAIRGLTWTTVGFGGICLVGSYILIVINVFKHPQSMQNQWGMFKTMSSISPWDSPFLLGFNFFMWLGAAFLGGAGMFLLNRHHRKQGTPAIAPAQLSII